MQYLKNKICYLAGPISAVADDGTAWRNSLTPQLETYGINVIDPCKKTTEKTNEVGADKIKFKKLILEENWSELKKEFWPVARYDLRAVDKADFLIFNYLPTVPGVGAWHEIVMASHIQKKPVLVKYDKAELKNFNPWVCVLVKEEHLFATWEDMFKHLDCVNQGVFNTSYWTL